MTDHLSEFQAKFRVTELALLATDHWVWSLRPGQCTIGAGILSLARPATAFAQMTAAEGADLAVIVAKLEAVLERFSAPDKMNYLMLMMVDPHLHFHVIPRYAQAREVAGRTWTDSGWPALPNIADNADLAGEPVLLDIHTALQGLLAAR